MRAERRADSGGDADVVNEFSNRVEVNTVEPSCISRRESTAVRYFGALFFAIAGLTLCPASSLAQGPLLSGGNHGGAISAPGEIDTWTFEAAQHDTIALAIGEVVTSGADPGFVPWIRLIGPTGTQLGSGFGALAGRITVTAPLTGTYTVLARDGSGTGTALGSYLLRLVKAPGAIVVPADDEGGPLTNGGNHAGVIKLGDLDPWTLQAAQNDTIALKIGEVLTSEIDPGFVPWIRLVGPNGEQLASGFGALAGQITVAAPLTGTYTVLVTDGSGTGAAAGSYLLRLVKSPGAVVVPADDEGGPLTSGGNHAGAIKVGDLDPWTFQAAQKDTVALKIGEVLTSEIDPGFVPWIRLFGPDGDQLASGFGALAGQITVTAPLTGSYTVLVTDGSGTGAAAGSYLLRLVKAPGSVVVPDGDQGGPLTNGGNHAGVIKVGDLDPWTFQAAPNETIALKIGEVVTSEVDPGFVPWIRLFAPNGDQLASGFGALAGQITVTAALTGAYTVLVTDGSGTGAAEGSYLLHLVKTPGAFVVPAGDEGGRLSTGVVRAGAIHIGDLDPWSFITRGGAISVSIGEVIVGEVDPGFVPWIRLFGPTGAQVGSGFGALAGQINVTAASGGTYTVLVTDGSGTGAAKGNYTLTAVFPPGEDTDPAITAHPASTTVTAGQNAPFTVAASGSPTLAYRWQVSSNGGGSWVDVPNTAPYSGATSVTLTVTGATSALNGFQYRCVVGNGLGQAISSAAALTVKAPPSGGPRVPTDFDGDFKSDIGVFRPSTGQWFIRYSSQGHSAAAPGVFAWGLPGDLPVSGDFDGDRTMDLTVYRPSTGQWFILYSTQGHNPATAGVYQWGLLGDVPVVGDFDGDEKTELSVYRPATGEWFVRYSSHAYSAASAGHFQWGKARDVPIAGDFDGDGKTDAAVYRPSTNQWLIRNSSQGYNPASASAHQWGQPADVPLVADFDGDGKTDLTVYRPSTSQWFIANSTQGYNPGTATVFQWGLVDDKPIAIDTDGDGRTELTMFRPATREWFVRLSSQAYDPAAAVVLQWGAEGDLPLPRMFDASAAMLDFDADVKADLAVYRPSTGQWFVRTSQTGFNAASARTFQWGLAGDSPAAGDYDGDRVVDLAVYRPSTAQWFIRYSTQGYSANTYAVYQWGLPGDVPIVGDFDGDGKTDLTVFRPATGQWFIRYSAQGYSPASAGSFQWGLATDKPLAGDFDGDGKADLAVFRPATAQWFIAYSSQAYNPGAAGVFQWGLASDVPLVADFDADGKSELTIFRPSSGEWFVRYSLQGYSAASLGHFQWGLAGDVPVVADFDGDGRAEMTVFRPSAGNWFIRYSLRGYGPQGGQYQWGMNGDVPLPNR